MTITATVRVYINNGGGAFFNYRPDTALLHKTVEFDLNLPHCGKAIPAALEHVFEQLNVGGELVEATDWCDEYRAMGFRSLSVGDVVVIGENAFACDSFGWRVLSTDDFVAGICPDCREQL